MRRLVEGDRAGHEGRRDGSGVHVGRQVVRQRRRQAVQGQGFRRVRGEWRRVAQGPELPGLEDPDDGVLQAVEDGQADYGVLARVHEPERDRQRADDQVVRRLVEGDRARHEGRADRSRVRSRRRAGQQFRQAVQGQGRHPRGDGRAVHPGRHAELRGNHQAITQNR